jgi:hypothetical protein
MKKTRVKKSRDTVPLNEGNAKLSFSYSSLHFLRPHPVLLPASFSWSTSCFQFRLPPPSSNSNFDITFRIPTSAYSTSTSILQHSPFHFPLPIFYFQLLTSLSHFPLLISLSYFSLLIYLSYFPFLTSTSNFGFLCNSNPSFLFPFQPHFHFSSRHSHTGPHSAWLE